MNQYNGDYYQRTYEEQNDAVKGLNAFITKVFGWMFLGLILTAGIAYYVSTNASLIRTIFQNPAILIVLFIVEILLVSVLSARVMKLSNGMAIGLFLAYAAVNGLTLSFIFLAYTGATISTAFGTTALTFGVMCAYGYFTRADLTRFRSLLYMGLIGMLILSLVNIFLGSSSLEWIISIVGLFVFLGLTAYDMQKLKDFYYHTEGDMHLRNNLGVYGALSLYLDFINLFLILLRFFGRGRD